MRGDVVSPSTRRGPLKAYLLCLSSPPHHPRSVALKFSHSLNTPTGSGGRPVLLYRYRAAGHPTGPVHNSDDTGCRPCGVVLPSSLLGGTAEPRCFSSHHWSTVTTTLQWTCSPLLPPATATTMGAEGPLPIDQALRLGGWTSTSLGEHPSGSAWQMVVHCHRSQW
jgi:hypothetical protein